MQVCLRKKKKRAGSPNLSRSNKVTSALNLTHPFPTNTRKAIYNLYRVPLNVIVLGVLLRYVRVKRRRLMHHTRLTFYTPNWSRSNQSFIRAQSNLFFPTNTRSDISTTTAFACCTALLVAALYFTLQASRRSLKCQHLSGI